jgi:DNA (cytosine-5)-methyltransferase 1
MDSASLVVHGTQDQCVGIHTAFALGRNNGGENAVCFTGEITHTLKANGFDGSEDGSGRGQPITSTKNRLRRLTPIECERLQGFRDGYTMVTFNGKPAKDGPRYKAIGNSMAVPCMKWIGNRINLLELHHEH